jgi:hypothetical protein
MTDLEAITLSRSMSSTTLPSIKRQIARELFDYYKAVLSPKRPLVPTTRRIP